MSDYINIKRLKDKVHCGYVNFPYGTEFDVDDDGFIYTMKNGQKLQVCFEFSDRAFTYFAYNQDGRGKERKELIKYIVERMSRVKDKDIQFEIFFHDFTALKYKKHNNSIEWSWDRAKVHKALIDDLEHIRSLVDSMYV